jgi:hypothetical protein
MQLRTIEANDDTGGAVWHVKRATWWSGTFSKFVMVPLCGCWVLLLLVGVTPEGSFFSDVRPTYVRIITVRNRQLKFELIII